MTYKELEYIKRELVRLGYDVDKMNVGEIRKAFKEELRERESK